MLNIEYYKDRLKNVLIDVLRESEGTGFQVVIDAIENAPFEKHSTSDEGRAKEYVDWLCEEKKRIILNDNEKEWLLSFTKPYKELLQHFEKMDLGNGNDVVLQIKLKDTSNIFIPLTIPGYTLDGMYIGEKYAPEDLGL